MNLKKTLLFCLFFALTSMTSDPVTESSEEEAPPQAEEEPLTEFYCPPAREPGFFVEFELNFTKPSFR